MFFQRGKSRNPGKRSFVSPEKSSANFSSKPSGNGLVRPALGILLLTFLCLCFSENYAYCESSPDNRPASGKRFVKNFDAQSPLEVVVSAGLPFVREDSGQSSPYGIWKPGRWIPFRIRIATTAETTETLQTVSNDAFTRNGASAGKEELFTGKIVLEVPDSDGATAVTEQTIVGPLPCEIELCARFGTTRGSYRLKIFGKTRTANSPFLEKQLVDASSDVTLDATSSSRQEPREELTLLSEISGAAPGALSETKGIFLVVGSENGGVAAGVAQMPCPSSLKPEVIRVPSARELPKNPAAWELIDVLFLSLDDDALLSWKPEDVHRLETWTRRGGTLVLSVGKSAEKWANDPKWTAFLPGKFEKVLPVRETAAMEVFAKSPIPVSLLGVSEKFRIQVAKFVELHPAIQVRAEQFDLPLVLRRGMELGQIHWVAFDLTHPALVAWEGRGNFIASLLDFPEKNADSSEKNVRGMERGFDDMAGQLRSALDDFDGIRPPSFGLLILLFVLYLILIGPGCWFLCHKMTRGGEVASWSAFLLTVLFCCLILSFIAGTGGEIRLNLIQVTDFVQENGSFRQSLWGNVWAPEAERLDLRLESPGFPNLPHEKSNDVKNRPETMRPETKSNAQTENEDQTETNRKESNAQTGSNAQTETNVQAESNAQTENEAETETRFAWFGLPGNYLGGMNSRITEVSSAISSEKNHYQMENGKMQNVPFSARSTKSFCAERWLQFPQTSVPQFASLRILDNYRVLGEIRNPLDVPIENALLCCGNWAYEIGTLEPGASFLIDETTPYFAAAALLVEADFLKDHTIKSSVGIRRVNRPYQPDSRNAAYVMRTMLFYEKAGGRAYSGLNHQYQQFLDVSSLLNCGVAVFWGQIPSESAPKKSALFTNFTIQKHQEKEPLPLDNPKDQNVRFLRVFIEPKIESKIEPRKNAPVISVAP